MKERPLASYWNGEAVPSERFNSDLEGFSDVVWPEFKKDHATAQFDLQGEVWWKRNKRLIPDRQEHLQRPTIEDIRQKKKRRTLIVW